MALTHRTIYDNITILEDGQIQLRRARVILDDDGVTEISRQFHRQVLEPGHDVTQFEQRVRDVCALIWTPAVVAAYRQWRERQGDGPPASLHAPAPNRFTV